MKTHSGSPQAGDQTIRNGDLCIVVRRTPCCQGLPGDGGTPGELKMGQVFKARVLAGTVGVCSACNTEIAGDFLIDAEDPSAIDKNGDADNMIHRSQAIKIGGSGIPLDENSTWTPRIHRLSTPRGHRIWEPVPVDPLENVTGGAKP